MEIASFHMSLFTKKNRSKFCRGSGCSKKISENRGNSFPGCSNRCFGVCLDCFLDLNYMIEYLELLAQGRGKQLMTERKSQTCCKNANIDCLGHINEKEVLPRCVKQKNKCVRFHSNPFCVFFSNVNE